MKRILFFVGAVGMICLFCASAVNAQHMGRGMMGPGYGMGPGSNYGGWNQMSLEQQKEWKQMRTEFWKDTLSLRQKLANKQMELQTLWEDDNPDPDKAQELSDEIADLQAQLAKKHDEFLIKCRDKFGDQGWSCPGGGYGMGPGMMQGRGYGMGPGMMGQGFGMGPGYGMGPGMMHGPGYGMGPGMMYGGGYGMGPGYGMAPGYGMGPGYGQGYGARQYRQPKTPIDKEEAKQMLEDYVRSTRNPNLKIGKLKEKEETFEAEIHTKDGSLVDKIIIDKKSGWMQSRY